MTETEKQIQAHPAADIFPLMQGDDFDELVADIRDHGQQEPLLLHPDGSILDGRNRYRACLELGIEPLTRTWEPKGDEVSTVLILNLHRRHLTSLQRACVAVEILPHLEAQAKERERIRKSADPTTDEATTEKSPESKKGESRARAAKIVGTNSNYVSLAKKLATGDKTRFAQVHAGEIKLQPAVWQMEGEESTRKWQARKKKQEEEEKAERAAAPDPEEAKRQAREQGHVVQANDGAWYDGRTEEEIEEQNRTRRAIWQRESDCREVLWAVEALAQLETDPEVLVPEFSKEDLKTLADALAPAIELLEKFRPALQSPSDAA